MNMLRICIIALTIFLQSHSIVCSAQAPYQQSVSNNPPSYCMDDIDDDTVVVVTRSPSKPSSFVVLMREFGISLLMKYVALKEFLGSSWNNIKDNYNKLLVYVYARQKA